MNAAATTLPVSSPIAQRTLFHHVMALGVMGILASTCLGYWIEGARPRGVGAQLLALVVVLAGIAPFPPYLREKGHTERAEALLALMWGLVLAFVIPMSVDVAARVCLPLQDGLLVKADQALGANVPAVVAWSAHHWLGQSISATYPLLMTLLPAALVLPAIAGRPDAARGYVCGNLFAFVIGLPIFILLPAIGPWYGYHTAAIPDQLSVQQELLALRSSAPYVFHPAGVVCFPSFHVIWAILCARSLWSFRLLRVPSTMLCALVGISTITTGWHYLSDVIAGGLLAVCAITASTEFVTANSSSSHTWSYTIKSFRLMRKTNSWNERDKNHAD